MWFRLHVPSNEGVSLPGFLSVPPSVRSCSWWDTRQELGSYEESSFAGTLMCPGTSWHHPICLEMEQARDMELLTPQERQSPFLECLSPAYTASASWVLEGIVL